MTPEERRTFRRQFRDNFGGEESGAPQASPPHRDRPVRPGR
jgi:hypothetical protein